VSERTTPAQHPAAGAHEPTAATSADVAQTTPRPLFPQFGLGPNVVSDLPPADQVEPHAVDVAHVADQLGLKLSPQWRDLLALVVYLARR
jgi:hypothetical protein